VGWRIPASEWVGMGEPPRHAGGWGAVPGLKAGANPSRSSAVEGKGCDRRARPHCTGCIE